MSRPPVEIQVQEGITEIRLQHEKLTRYYTQVESLIASGVENFSALDLALDGLIHYTTKCFDREESLMRLTGYPRTADHTRSHDMFMRRLNGYRSKLLEGKYSANEVMSLLKIWMNGHIEQQDLHLIESLQGFAESPA